MENNNNKKSHKEIPIKKIRQESEKKPRNPIKGVKPLKYIK